MLPVLLLEDDPAIAQTIVYALQREGFAVEHCLLMRDALARLQRALPAAVILDVGLPDGSGLDLCRQLRQDPATAHLPLLILSARSEEFDRVLGLELGADDYLAKPFSMLELVARVKALFRRQEAMSRNLKMDAGTLSFDGLTIDPIAREVLLNHQAIDLTPREFDLLYFFAKHPGKVFSRLSLLNQVWGYQHEGYEHTVNTHINRLRIKIESNPAEPERILTVWGMGYKFAAAPQE